MYHWGPCNHCIGLCIYLDVKISSIPLKGEKRNSMKTTYKIDPAHSTEQFVVRHMMITNVRGGFSGVQGTVVYDPADLNASSVDVTIDKTTLSTGDATRDTHVKSADFLDVEKHPTITFKSKKITRDGDDL